MNQPDLFSLPRNFQGATFVPEYDSARLTGQHRRVFDVMATGRWHTLSEIQRHILAATGIHDSEAGISARLRDLRKAQWGSYTVERRRRNDPKSGLHEYRVVR